MIEYIITNEKGEILHTNNEFYGLVINCNGIKVVRYKYKKCAKNRAYKVNGIVAEKYENQSYPSAIRNKFGLFYENNLK
jgi:hypothetical protein